MPDPRPHRDDKAQFLDRLAEALRDLTGPNPGPVVVYAAMWPLLKAMGRKDATAVEMVLDRLIELFGSRGLLMPSFTFGYDADGICDLDQLPGSTGVLSEALRQRLGTVRTLSAWFSHVAVGRAAAEVADLQPEEAWGDGSLYDWMERQDACLLMLGTHSTHCSYLHRLEWLTRDRIPYRFKKTFAGVVRRNQCLLPLRETLFVRCREPVSAVNDFTTLVPHLQEAGMRDARVDGVNLAAYRATAVRDVLLPLLQSDPLYLLKNRDEFLEKAGHGHHSSAQ